MVGEASGAEEMIEIRIEIPEEEEEGEGGREGGGGQGGAGGRGQGGGRRRGARAGPRRRGSMLVSL